VGLSSLNVNLSKTMKGKGFTPAPKSSKAPCMLGSHMIWWGTLYLIDIGLEIIELTSKARKGLLETLMAYLVAKNSLRKRV